MSNPIQRAIEHLGNQKALAEALSVSPSFISQCLSGHRKMPIEHCRRIEELTNGAVTKSQIRPDIYEEVPADRSAEQAA